MHLPTCKQVSSLRVNLKATIEGQIEKMKKLHELLNRLSSEATSSIDEISRKISLEYMRKKTNDLKRRRDALKTQTSVASQAPETKKTQTEERRLELSDDFLNSDLFGEHSMLHDFGKIPESHRGFGRIGNFGSRSRS